MSVNTSTFLFSHPSHESMARVPDDFREEFDAKGESFFEIAKLLYTHPDRRYTQDELAEKMDLSNSRISKHTREMVEEGWLNRHEDQTTFGWNSDAHNPASTEGITAIKRFYADLLGLLKKHSETTPGAFAVVGFATILAGVVVSAFSLGVMVTQDTAIPPWIFLVIVVGLFLTGFIVTLFSPLQAVVNRFIWSLLPESLFQKE